MRQGAHLKLLPLLRSGDPELRASAAFVLGALLPARRCAEQRPQPQPMGGSPHASMHGGSHNGRNSDMGSETILPVNPAVELATHPQLPMQPAGKEVPQFFSRALQGLPGST